MADKCMGHCCMDVGLFNSPDELESLYQRCLYSTRKPLNIDLTYPMLTFYKKDRCHPSLGDVSADVYHYTCKHFDSETKLCTIYDIRPQMCRDYPENNKCDNPKCEWKGVASGKTQT